MLRIIPVLILIVFLISCGKSVTQKKNAITKIEVATTGCLSGCPITMISIDSSLIFNYFGGYKANLKGYYKGKVKQGFWDALNDTLRQINYKHLDTAENMGLDGEYAEIIYSWGASKRKIKVSIYGADTTQFKSKFFRQLAYSYNKVLLHKIPDSISFAVRYWEPPRPKKDNVRFPPIKRVKI